MENERIKAVLVNVSADKDGEDALLELESLADTAGYETAAFMTQRRKSPDRAYYLGTGKLGELKETVNALGAEAVIFDNDVSGTQFYNLEKFLSVKVIDRASLILEIFAKHAVSNEGKLQVELAQKKLMLPRVIGKGMVLSRQGGGGAGGGGARRGGGEQQLELDKRTIRKEIEELELKIDKLTAERALRRARREKSGAKTVSIVGYTNAGKSTLMNSLTKAGVVAEDKLFATLDPVSRRLWLAENREAVIIDTVGFISRLPHEFIRAFRSTLEEVKYADLILHVMDASSSKMLEEYDVVNGVLDSIGVKDVPIITVLNKCDRSYPEIIPDAENIVYISAKNSENINTLKDKISLLLFGEADSEITAFES